MRRRELGGDPLRTVAAPRRTGKRGFLARAEFHPDELSAAVSRPYPE